MSLAASFLCGTLNAFLIGVCLADIHSGVSGPLPWVLLCVNLAVLAGHSVTVVTHFQGLLDAPQPP